MAWQPIYIYLSFVPQYHIIFYQYFSFTGNFMDEFLSWLYFALIVLALVSAWYLLNRMDKRTKNKYKKDAYRLLDTPSASKQEVIKTIKMLRLYGGRFRKDKEFIQLVERLIEKLDKMDGITATQPR
jgi:hypothetical protein